MGDVSEEGLIVSLAEIEQKEAEKLINSKAGARNAHQHLLKGIKFLEKAASSGVEDERIPYLMAYCLIHLGPCQPVVAVFGRCTHCEVLRYDETGNASRLVVPYVHGSRS